MDDQSGTITKKFDGNLAFVKDVATYFMDFLETDFHKRKNPRRRVQLRNGDNLLVATPVEKYPKFNGLIWDALGSTFSGSGPIVIERDVYKGEIPIKLLDLVNLQAQKVQKKDVSLVVSEVAETIEKSSQIFPDDREKALLYVMEQSAEIFRNKLVAPFMRHIEQPVISAELADENDLYLMESELVDIFCRTIENMVSDSVNELLVGNKIAVKKMIEGLLSEKFVCDTIVSFFGSFGVGDLHTELFELERNRSILDKQDFYLYFFDVSFQNNKYPIFYIPLHLSRDGDKFAIEFDSQVYVNKKAIEFIVQEFNAETGLAGSMKSVKERVIYIGDGVDDAQKKFHDILTEFANILQLDKPPAFTKHKTIYRSKWARITNSCYIALFDKADEALVNDYEEILALLASEDAVIGGAFRDLIHDFINNEPNRVNRVVTDEWDSASTPEKLVFQSPIPLNAEQRQIVAALNKDDCNYVTVEGPPGTGKSHTITAILFDAILKEQSVLVLSDKKEALDVVEDKITDTLKSVRKEENFQNPILRLGKAGSNYAKILSPQSIREISGYHNALRSKYAELKNGIDDEMRLLYSSIKNEIESNEQISIDDIFEAVAHEKLLTERLPGIDVVELAQSPTIFSLARLAFLAEVINDLLTDQEDDTVRMVRRIFTIAQDDVELSSFIKRLTTLSQALDEINVLLDRYPNLQSLCNVFESLNENDLKDLRQYVSLYTNLRMPVLGYLLQRKKIAAVDHDFRNRFPGVRFGVASDNLATLTEAVDLYETIKHRGNASGIDYLELIHFLLQKDEHLETASQLVSLLPEFSSLTDFIDECPRMAESFRVTKHVGDIASSMLYELDEMTLNQLDSYNLATRKLEEQFGDIENSDYLRTKKRIEEYVTMQMTYILDGRVVQFHEENAATAKTLRDIIKRKGRFPKKDFEKLKKAFPCILAGIRDYAEYIPLEPELFDLVIIDEASQVSVAQAFPALMRAKKVLIFGDRKQFSNIKATQARSETNKEYLVRLRDSFTVHVSTDPTHLTRLERFDIKTSILEFFEFISNYQSQLLKHFRGYRELISYSNKYFYNDKLQVMKIRSKPVNEILEFTVLEDASGSSTLPNSNEAEIDFIVSELKKLHDSQMKISVGIITPHTNQQKLLVDKITRLPEHDYYFDDLNLKIMTFDTCQGEERDRIYYSMVANEKSDKLWGVFIKNLNDVDVEEEGKIKAQRLNVGFSRAKEKMHFVLSKPIEKFNGSIGEALQHYEYIRQQAATEYDATDTDGRSAMEPVVLNWFYQTDFWKNVDKDKCLFQPQFELGKYLKQLDRNYTHPNYVVDFLLVYKDEKHRDHKIVIEYDGFLEHFESTDETNELTYEHYYNDSDVYRQKVLEGYGYKFIRINKFNAGVNPIETLDTRIVELITEKSYKTRILEQVQVKAQGLSDRTMKKCPSCSEIKPQSDYRDSSLMSGYGRICLTCKSAKREQKVIQEQGAAELAKNLSCPRCNSPMTLRSGRYGKFFGCSNYPRCKGTHQLLKNT